MSRSEIDANEPFVSVTEGRKADKNKFLSARNHFSPKSSDFSRHFYTTIYLARRDAENNWRRETAWANYKAESRNISPTVNLCSGKKGSTQISISTEVFIRLFHRAQLTLSLLSAIIPCPWASEQLITERTVIERINWAQSRVSLYIHRARWYVRSPGPCYTCTGMPHRREAWTSETRKLIAPRLAGCRRTCSEMLLTRRIIITISRH